MAIEFSSKDLLRLEGMIDSLLSCGRKDQNKVMARMESIIDRLGKEEVSTQWSSLKGRVNRQNVQQLRHLLSTLCVETLSPLQRKKRPAPPQSLKGDAQVALWLAALNRDQEQVNLSGCELDHFPEELKNFPHLKKINVGNNCISQVPPWISLFKSLEILDLSENLLERLPLEIGELSSLKELQMASNGQTFGGFGAEIGSLRSLQVLNASDCTLTELPESIGKLHNLQTLNLSLNAFRVFPRSILSLRSLAALDMRENYLLKIPDELTALEKLKKANFSGNELSAPLSARLQESRIHIDMTKNPIVT